MQEQSTIQIKQTSIWHWALAYLCVPSLLRFQNLPIMLFLQLMLLPVRKKFQLAFHAKSIYVCMCRSAIYHCKTVQKHFPTLRL